MVKPTIDRAFDDWKEREALAEAMIPLIGKLYRRNVVLYMHGVPLFNESVIEIMRIHRRVRQIEKNELSEFETHPMIAVLAELDLAPAHVDIGKLASAFMTRSRGTDARGLCESSLR